MRKTIVISLKLLLVSILLNQPGQQAMAYIDSAYTVTPGACEYDVYSVGYDSAQYLTIGCVVASSSYVPHSGNYKVRTKVIVSDVVKATADTTTAFLDQSKSINEQSVTVTGASGSSIEVVIPANAHFYTCMVLIDESGKEYLISHHTCPDGDIQPLPPTPVPDTACTINNGNTLTVELETIERADLPTVPGTGSGIKNYAIPVTCTGGVDVPVKMQVNYTPISVSGTQIVKSSSAGLGVAIIYDDKALATTDVTPATFNTGSSVLNLGFQAIRDPAVPVVDVTTGAFNASASLIMTQQ